MNDRHFSNCTISTFDTCLIKIRFLYWHIRTHHKYQIPRVLWAILREENKSRRSPSLSSSGKHSISRGISLPFSLATLLRISLASVCRPFFRSQRTDSGIRLSSHSKNDLLFCHFAKNNRFIGLISQFKLLIVQTSNSVDKKQECGLCPYLSLPPGKSSVCGM